MNKTELVASWWQREAAISKEAAAEAVDATFDNIASALQSGDTVRESSVSAIFRSHSARRRRGAIRAPARRFRYPASRVPKFKAGKALKEAVNS